ncbi:MAG: 30S ribosomal protein S16 [Candidatus Omnitrophica bacterium]|nr:30S ribosomal protein S16 [Candidatus Omnitrophota bacterium]
MMVTIRLQRRGTKKTPHHRIVVMDGRKAQGSRVLEVLGYYDPSKNPATCSVKESRLVQWLSSGAGVSEAVQRVLKTLKNISVREKT